MRTGSEIRIGDSNRPRKDGVGLRRAWCCSFGVVPRSSDTVHRRPNVPKVDQKNRQQQKQIKSHPKPPLHGGSVHSSPSPSSKIGRGLIDPRRILSPGRVSPIDSESSSTLSPLPENANVGDSVPVAATGVELEQELVNTVSKEEQREVILPGSFSSDDVLACGGDKDKCLDLRLALKGKNGRCLVLELDIEVLCRNSKFFKDLVLDSRKKVEDSFVGCRKIEVANIADLGLFRETIELMFEKDIIKLLMKMGASRTIDVLEVTFCFFTINPLSHFFGFRFLCVCVTSVSSFCCSLYFYIDRAYNIFYTITLFSIHRHFLNSQFSPSFKF